MIFETERLYVAKWKRGDIEELHALYNDEAIKETIAPNPTIEETSFIFEDQIAGYNTQCPSGRYFIVEKLTNKFIGLLLIKRYSNNDVEIGYSLKKNQWKKGYATEVVKESVRWLFESKGFDAMYAITSPENERSKKVLLKCGFLPKKNFTESGEEKHLFGLQREDVSAV